MNVGLAFRSAEIPTGSQYLRKNAPIGVPLPTRVSISFSSLVSMRSLLGPACCRLWSGSYAAFPNRAMHRPGEVRFRTMTAVSRVGSYAIDPRRSLMTEAAHRTRFVPSPHFLWGEG